MIAINTLTSHAAPLDISNIDTDQIIPKQFLKRIERTGYGEFLFYDWRRIQESTAAAHEDEQSLLSRGLKPGRPRPHLRAQPAAVCRREDPDRRQELWLRIIPRARRLGFD